MYLIVGLGNPGAEYAETRHNVGWTVLDLLAERHGIVLSRRGPQSRFGEGIIAGQRVTLVKPLTYMNLSGQALPPLMRPRGIAPERVIVLTDDTNLPVGRLRVRGDGSAGGHNGLKSLIQSLGTEAFPRVRVGVGAPPGEGRMIGHVLGRIRPQEREPLAQAIAWAADAVECLLAQGVGEAMARFNGLGRPEPPPRSPLRREGVAERESGRDGETEGRTEGDERGNPPA